MNQSEYEKQVLLDHGMTARKPGNRLPFIRPGFFHERVQRHIEMPPAIADNPPEQSRIEQAKLQAFDWDRATDMRYLAWFAERKW